MNRAFEAPDLIEVMDEAVRYNRFLTDRIVAWASGAEEVLDFGAGNGRFCLAVDERGIHVRAVEPDPELRAGIAARGVGAVSSLEEVASGSVDAVYSINVLEHIEDDEAVLRALADRLRPHGRLLLYVPAFQVLFSANDLRVGHVRRYRREELARRVRDAGFRIESAHYVDSIGFAAGLAYRFLGNPDGDLDVRAVRLYDRFAFPLSRLLDLVLRRWVGKNLVLMAVRANGADARAPLEHHVDEQPVP